MQKKKDRADPVAPGDNPGRAASQSQALFAQALALHQSGQLAQAGALYEKALKLDPGHFDALHLSGVLSGQMGNLRLAARLIRQALARNPQSALAHNNLGIALRDLGEAAQALESFDNATRLQAGYAEAHYNRGLALQDLKRLDTALESYDRALALQPGHAQAHYNKGIALQDLRRFEDALQSYDRAIGARADFAEAWANRGLVLHELGRHQAAVDSYDHALARQPANADIHFNKGLALQALKNHAAALQEFDRAIALRPGQADALDARGSALRFLGRLEEAVACHEQAVALRPDHALAHNNLGLALQALGRVEAALAHYERAIELGAECDFLYGNWLHAKMLLGDWRGLAQACAQLEQRIVRGDKAAHPFTLLSISDSALLQKRACESWVRDAFPAGGAPAAPAGSAPHPKIRIGYFSTDFRDHPVSHLAAGLFECHDKNRFELFAFAFGVDQDDPVRRRVAAAFDHFIPVGAMSDQAIAALARDRQIDIAVDLGGYTQNARTGIFALRPAPVQVSYLGYPGTMAAPFIDYLMADRTLIPEQSLQHYSEKIAFLPGCFQPNDHRRALPSRRWNRSELDLPDQGFVFCCFNNTFKITPEVFGQWMRILDKVEGSVLWLSGAREVAAQNLRKEAAQRGLDPARLVFAGRIPSLEDHLARYRAADLFLDTFPYNAHTTASDALWAGLPVLTRAGASFAGRVAASLLGATGMAGLVTHTVQAYEDLAVELALAPPRLREIRDTLERNRRGAALFDTPGLARNIEAAYTAMHERHRAGLAPDHISV